jgi:DNA-directed RNA polymerase specialized sigma24 family protein
MKDKEKEPCKNHEEILRRAQVAASLGHTDEMIKALYQSFVLDGLARRIQWKWDALPSDEVQFILIGAIHALYQAVNRGEKISDIVAYLLKVSDRKATDSWRARQRQADMVEDLKIINVNSQQPVEWPSGLSVEENELIEEGHREKRRAKAIAVVRSFIPRLGQANVQAVINIIFDSVEKGIEDISSREIGDMLGLTRNTVAMSRKRGFERLLRILHEEGHVDQNFNFISLDYDDGEEDEKGEAEDD